MESTRVDGLPADAVLSALDRFELRPERVLEALRALRDLPAEEKLADADALDRCCRLLIDVQGFLPWELEVATWMVLSRMAVDESLRVRAGRLEEWLTWWDYDQSAIPQYLTWGYPAWADRFATP